MILYFVWNYYFSLDNSWFVWTLTFKGIHFLYTDADCGMIDSIRIILFTYVLQVAWNIDRL